MQQEDFIAASEFCLYNNVEVSFIHSLKEYGLIEITTLKESEFIPCNQLIELEKKIRLHYDLNINLEGIDVITNLLQRIEHLQNETATLKNRLRLYESEGD